MKFFILYYLNKFLKNSNFNESFIYYSTETKKRIYSIFKTSFPNINIGQVLFIDIFLRILFFLKKVIYILFACLKKIIKQNWIIY